MHGESRLLYAVRVIDVKRSALGNQGSVRPVGRVVPSLLCRDFLARLKTPESADPFPLRDRYHQNLVFAFVPLAEVRRRNGSSVGIGVQHELSVLALVKGGERFIFVYDDVSREMLIDAIRDHAADPEVALSWFDAAVLTERARQQATVGNPGDSPRNGA
jgi:hypothetical protein